MGGLPYVVDEEDFFSGFSVPRNKEIMRVFRDLEIVEQLGSGIPRILKTYGRDAFEIRKSFVRVVFYYAKPFENTVTVPLQTETRVETRVKTSQLILDTLAENPTLTLAQLAEMIEKSISAVERASAKLVKEGKLRHVGPRKGGHWRCWRIEGMRGTGLDELRMSFKTSVPNHQPAWLLQYSASASSRNTASGSSLSVFSLKRSVIQRPDFSSITIN